MVKHLNEMFYVYCKRSVRREIIFFRKVLLILGWITLLFLAYKVSQFDYEMANFDPFEILGVSQVKKNKNM